jgi:hypothetical protein
MGGKRQLPASMLSFARGAKRRGILPWLTPLALLIGALFVALLFPITAAHAISFSSPTNYTVPPTGVVHGLQSVAVGDFNGDLDPDLAIAHEDGNKVSVLLGAAGGTFTGPTDVPLFSHANPLSVTVGEFNGDSDPDLAVANEGASDGSVPGNVSILLGATGGTFSAPMNFPAGEKPQQAAIGDFNGDSDPDLAVPNETPSMPSGTVSILLGTAGVSFAAPTNYTLGNGPRAVTIGDFNGDSDPDLAVANQGTNNISVLVGTAGGSFTGPTNYPVCSTPNELATADFNGDSDLDLAVVNELCDSVSILPGGTGATFGPRTDFTVGSLPDAVAVGDLNGDSDPDLAVANQSSDNVSVLLGSTAATFAGSFNFPASDGPSAVTMGEFNGDTRPDLALTNEVTNHVSILLGVPDGYARPKSATPMTFKLVPAFNECTSPNGTHGAPFSSGSCDPSTQSSSLLTFNGPDRPAPFTGMVAGTGLLTMKIFCTDAAAPPCTAQAGDQQDVKIDASVNAVRCTGTSGGCTGAGATYAGKLLFSTGLRITDRLNTPVQEPATVSDTPFRFGMQCATGNCSISTTADAVYPGLVQELKRAVWQLGQIEVLDGGPDGNFAAAPAPASGVCPPACAGNDGETVFMRQGIFAP